MYYADEMELGANSREFLWEVIRKVDSAYIKAINQKLTEEREQTTRRGRGAHG